MLPNARRLLGHLTALAIDLRVHLRSCTRSRM
jgi:hypothetical protein